LLTCILQKPRMGIGVCILGRVVELRCPAIYVAHELDGICELKGNLRMTRNYSGQRRIDLNKR
jgi:hypothetical protein